MSWGSALRAIKKFFWLCSLYTQASHQWKWRSPYGHKKWAAEVQGLQYTKSCWTPSFNSRHLTTDLGKKQKVGKKIPVHQRISLQKMQLILWTLVLEVAECWQVWAALRGLMPFSRISHASVLHGKRIQSLGDRVFTSTLRLFDI